MRWFFWRRKPSLKTEERSSLPESEPEKITVVIQDSSPATGVAGGVIVTSATEPARDRWASRHRHRTSNAVLLRGDVDGPHRPETALRALHRPRMLLRSLSDSDPLQPDRLAYFTRGAYTPRGLEAVRLTAPGVASLVAQRSAALTTQKAVGHAPAAKAPIRIQE